MYDVLITLASELEHKKFSVEDMEELKVLLDQLEELYGCKRIQGVEVKKVKVKV